MGPTPPQNWGKTGMIEQNKTELPLLNEVYDFVCGIDRHDYCNSEQVGVILESICEKIKVIRARYYGGPPFDICPICGCGDVTQVSEGACSCCRHCGYFGKESLLAEKRD